MFVSVVDDRQLGPNAKPLSTAHCGRIEAALRAGDDNSFAGLQAILSGNAATTKLHARPLHRA